MTTIISSTGLLWLLALLVPVTTSAQTIQQLIDNGPTDRRINIVLLAEGYTAAESDEFLADATGMASALLQAEPYAGYASYFNAFAIFVPSNQSGSDHPWRNEYRDTYFNSSFDSYGTQRLVTIPPNDHEPSYAKGRGRVDALLRSLMPEYDLVMVVVNDEEYGGSGGSVAVVSVNGASAEIAVHELGHSFARLGDEYSTPYPGYPDTEEPNTTRETRRDFIKWRIWMEDAIPLPTPSNDPTYSRSVGLFEGAHYHQTGWYRPQQDCRMRSLGQEFCRVCAETIVKSAYDLISPIDSVFPVGTMVTITGDEEETFGVSPLRPATHRLGVEWFIDGEPVIGMIDTSFTIAAADLGNGSHLVRVMVIDSTKLVRNDPNALLRQIHEWVVNVSGVLSVPSDGGVLPAITSQVSITPNPFADATTIGFTLARPADVRLEIVAQTGETIATLVDGRRHAGSHSVGWEAAGITQGVYFYRLNVGGEMRSGMVMVVR